MSRKRKKRKKIKTLLIGHPKEHTLCILGLHNNVEILGHWERGYIINGYRIHSKWVTINGDIFNDIDGQRPLYWKRIVDKSS